MEVPVDTTNQQRLVAERLARKHARAVELARNTQRRLVRRGLLSACACGEPANALVMGEWYCERCLTTVGTIEIRVAIRLGGDGSVR